MPTAQEIDAAFEVAARESHWSINKIETVRRMLEAAEHVRPSQTQAAIPESYVKTTTLYGVAED